MPSAEVGPKKPVSPAKSSSKESKDKHNSKKRKPDVVNEGVSGMKKRKKEEEEEKKEEKEKAKEKKEKAKEKKEKAKEKGKNKVNVKDAGDQTPTKEERTNKNLKEKLQSINTELLVTEPLCSNKSDTPGNPAIAIISTTPTSPFKTILKSPVKKMDITKSPLETVDSNAGKVDGTSPLPKSALSKPTKPKKSVKFHSEAAAEDGESRQRIHNALIAAYKASEAAEEAAVTPEELADSLEVPAKKQKREKRKRDKKEKVKRNGKDENAKQSALSYMLEYHKSRGTWKFQKAKQNWILRNAFNVTEIEGTKENDAALKAYVAGLQGQEARNRMVGEAKKILKSGGEGIEKDSRGGVEIDEEKENKMARAKLVMIGLGHEGEDDDEEDNVEKDSEEDIKDGGGDGSSEGDEEDEDSDDDEDE